MLFIIPFIKKYQKNPVTGQPLKGSELVKMHWSKNEKGEYQDPISYKVFTDFTHIVCIRTSGYVYAYDTILELNKKPKHYVDLMTSNCALTQTSHSRLRTS
jgi:peptidyl-prolyl cis-trans isomerase-like protein 2